MTIVLIALLIALAFEFINGFHDTANAIATIPFSGLPNRKRSSDSFCQNSSCPKMNHPE